LPDRVLLLDLLREVGQEELLGAVAEELGRLEGPDGTWSRYARAALGLIRLARGSGALEEVRDLLAQIKERRPDWSRAVLLQAQVDDMDGKKPAALAGYLRAFDLGERQLALVQRLVQLLLARDRYLEADAVLRRAQQQGALPVNLARLAADIALRVRNYDRALTLARQVPAVPGQEYRQHLWRGQILTAAGRLTEAEEELQEALRLGDRAPAPWLALLEMRVRTNRWDDAEGLLPRMIDRLDPADRNVARAAAEELLAHFDKADQLYRAALRERPTDGELLQRAAAFYSRLDRKQEAELLLRRLLDPAGFVPDDALPAVRRRLAVLLAAGDDEAKYLEALALLDTNGKEGEETAADQLARALVLAVRPSQRREALRTIEATVRQLPLSAGEHYCLARLYEAEKNVSVAREHMLNALAQDRNNPVYLVHHIRNLLDAGLLTEAQPWINRLARIEPESARVKAFQAQVQQ
jgi:tetratricopeptide (TPR) repeat protein